MNYQSVIPVAGIVFFACTLTGCLAEEYNTQSFDAGGATCLSGKQLSFVDLLDLNLDVEKTLPYGHQYRFVSNQSTLPVDPAGHETIDFTRADPFELMLPNGIEFGYYHQRFGTLFIGSNGTIAFETPGTGGDNLLDAFSSDQILLLPVDATVAGASVRYAMLDGKIVITFENVGGSTFQCELFVQGELNEPIRITYPVVGEDTRAGVVGIPDRFHGAILSFDSIEQFLESKFEETNLCEDSSLNPPGAVANLN